MTIEELTQVPSPYTTGALHGIPVHTQRNCPRPPQGTAWLLLRTVCHVLLLRTVCHVPCAMCHVPCAMCQFLVSHVPMRQLIHVTTIRHVPCADVARANWPHAYNLAYA